MRTPSQLVACLLLCVVLTLAQQPGAQQTATPSGSAAGPATAAAASSAPVDDKFVHDRFGREFTLIPEFPAMVADLNGDGIEDLVLAARAKSPMLDEGGFSYIVIDPYHAFFGFGDPKITSAFAAEDPSRKSEVLLVIHGAGSDAWRAVQPKSKFVLINIPFNAVSLRRVKVGKKAVMAIGVEESGGTLTTAAVFWEGNPKKNSGHYKYEPLGAALE